MANLNKLTTVLIALVGLTCIGRSSSALELDESSEVYKSLDKTGDIYDIDRTLETLLLLGED